MSFVDESERMEPYYVELEGLIVPTAEEFERGKRLATGLALLRQGILRDDLLDADEDQYQDMSWGSLNDVRIIVIPSFPVEREIIRGDSFYEHTSPHEKTKSIIQLVLSHIELVKPRSGEPIPIEPLINASSPSYRRRDGFPLREVSTLDLTTHQVAVHRRNNTV